MKKIEVLFVSATAKILDNYRIFCERSNNKRVNGFAAKGNRVGTIVDVCNKFFFFDFSSNKP